MCVCVLTRVYDICGTPIVVQIVQHCMPEEGPTRLKRCKSYKVVYTQRLFICEYPCLMYPYNL